MAASIRPKQSLVGIELVRLLAYEGNRIFTTDRARELAPRVGLKDAYVAESLYHLRRNDWIVSLRRGLYALSPTVPGVAAAHEFETAMALVDPAVISHWSALHHHGLTEQIPLDVFVQTTKGTWVPRRRNVLRSPGNGYPVGGITYRFVHVNPDRFFGSEKVWVGDARVSVTDLERTLLDGLSMPRHCGDFAEVLHAFRVAMGPAERRAHHGVRHPVGGDDGQAPGVGAGSPGSRVAGARKTGGTTCKGLPQAGPHRASEGAVQQPLDGPGEPAGDGCKIRPLRTRLEEARGRLGIRWDVLERDYLLSWVLAGISQTPALGDALVFKGWDGSQEVLLRRLPLLRGPGLLGTGWRSHGRGDETVGHGSLRDCLQAAGRIRPRRNLL